MLYNYSVALCALSMSIAREELSNNQSQKDRQSLPVALVSSLCSSEDEHQC